MSAQGGFCTDQTTGKFRVLLLYLCAFLSDYNLAKYLLWSQIFKTELFLNFNISRIGFSHLTNSVSRSPSLQFLPALIGLCEFSLVTHYLPIVELVVIVNVVFSNSRNSAKFISGIFSGVFVCEAF